MQPNNTPPRLSAAGITVPKRRLSPAAAPTTSTDKPSADTAAMFKRLRGLIDHCGPKPNRNDLVTALISACIGEGLHTRKQIIGVLYRLGFNNGHIAMMLKFGIGRTPESGHWRHNADKTYTLLA